MEQINRHIIVHTDIHMKNSDKTIRNKNKFLLLTASRHTTAYVIMIIDNKKPRSFGKVGTPGNIPHEKTVKGPAQTEYRVGQKNGLFFESL